MANVQLARNLKTLRLKYNYTQKDLSAILNITDRHTLTMKKRSESQTCVR